MQADATHEQDRETYEPPVVRDLGAVSEVTRGGGALAPDTGLSV